MITGVNDFCVVRMVLDSILPHAESGPNDHRKDAPPFIIFAIFLKMAIPIMDIFVKNFETHIQGPLGGIRNNSRIYLKYHFCDLSLKNNNLGFKMKILKFLGIRPSYDFFGEISPIKDYMYKRLLYISRLNSRDFRSFFTRSGHPFWEI